MRLRLLPTALALPLAMAACAHGPARPAAHTTEAAPERVVVTGSRIPQRVDPRTGVPDTAFPVRIVTREELLGTGLHGDLAAALRSLEPATGP